MNISSGCNSEGLAPVDFQLSSSFEDEFRKTVSNQELCYLCNTRQKNFHCKFCVAQGKFVHSSNVASTCSTSQLAAPYSGEGERFVVKKERLYSLQQERIKLVASFQDVMADKIKQAELRDEILIAKDVLKTLKNSIEEEKGFLNVEKLAEEEVVTKVVHRKRTCRKLHDKLNWISKYLQTKCESLKKVNGHVERWNDDIYNLRQIHVHNLVKYIFPLERKLLQHEYEADPVTAGRISELAEARGTNYVGGEWVYNQDNGNISEQLHFIVCPGCSLPADGNFEAYHSCSVNGSADYLGQPANMSNSAALARLKSPTRCIGAALCHITEFISLLAYFLDVNLTKTINFSVFSEKLSEGSFRKVVCKVQQNIIQLCLSQGISPSTLNAKHLISNLMCLEESQSFGRNGPYVLVASLSLSVDDSYHIVGHTGMSESESDSEANDVFVGDWEAVPNLPYTELQVPTPAISGGQQSRQQLSGTGEMSAGFFGNAAISVASLWRTATGQQQHKN